MVGGEQAANEVRRLVGQGWSCAEAIVLVLGDVLGRAEVRDPAGVTPLCGGIGRLGRVCGALTGCLVMIGRVTGRVPGPDGRPGGTGSRCRALARELVAEFERQVGSSECRDICGYTLVDPEQMRAFARERVMDRRCLPAMEVAVRTTLLLLDRDLPAEGRGEVERSDGVASRTRGVADG